MSTLRLATTILLVCFTVACARGREYDLQGQVLAVAPERQEITIKHDDIRGFMPGMTMPFKVRDRKWLEGRRPGELIRATLVVESRDAYVKNIERTGEAPLASGAAPNRAFDLIEAGQPVPDFAFVDHAGTSHRLSEFGGRTLAVTFIYTRCPLPDFCPLMDRNFAEVQRRLAADVSLRDRVHLLSVSFDPDFDNPAVLAKHAERSGAIRATWSFVTGDRDDVERFARGFGVSVIREDATAQEIVHNLRTAVIDAQGRLVKVFSGNDWQPADLVTELRAASERG